MKMRTGVWVCVAAVALILSAAALKNAAAAGSDGTAAITKLENDEVKADLAGDKAFYEKNLASDWSGGDSSGQWFTKAAMLKMMDDAKNNKYNSEKISELKVRAYGDAAVATYKDTYDAMVQGEHRMRTIIATDTWVKQEGAWKEVASHACTAK
jgi:hypothetical protein